MIKITFLGAGSSVFVKNVLGDCMLMPSLENSEFALYDVDKKRLDDSFKMLTNLKQKTGTNVSIKKYDNRREALRGAKYVINAIYVGAKERIFYKDFEIPEKYGLQQTIGDTVGIGGIIRGLRTIPVMLDFARDIEELCPEALFLNYTNPMSILTGAMLRYTDVNTVGLCHSVQACVPHLLKSLHLEEKIDKVKWQIAGINHMAWLLKITEEGKNLYPEIKRKAANKQKSQHDDMVRFELMLRFGYYVTESSTHHAEYHPYFIKKQYPELIDRYNISLNQHIKNYEKRMKQWSQMREDMVNNKDIEHERSHEYGSRIINAIETGEPYRIHGNVLNTGNLIENLPEQACVEVPCLIDGNGITPCYVGEIPEQLAALNRNSINPQLMTIEAAISKKKEYVYQAAMLDPHTSVELSIDDIVAMCDELLEANKEWLPEYQ